MNSSVMKIAFAVAYTCVGAVVVAYVSGLAYFLANKTMPAEIGFETWYRYWTAYSSDPLQHRRLISSALAAVLLVYGIPLALVVRTLNRGRSLHGDARWATEAEIRKAGLL